jgi:hypothetical protein
MVVSITTLTIHLGSLSTTGEKQKSLSHNEKMLNVIRALEALDEIKNEDIKFIQFYLNRKKSKKIFKYTVKRP